MIDLGPIFEQSWALDGAGRHQWRPVAPLASARVAFDKPALSWSGRAYVDMNVGTEPLEAGFRRWDWSREECGDATRLFYDVEDKDGAHRSLALDYRADGTIMAVDAAPRLRLPRTGWRVGRTTRAEIGHPARIVRTLEDTPFYSRSMLHIDRDGGASAAIHESVDLARFSAGWVQALLPFKMPRRTW